MNLSKVIHLNSPELACLKWPRRFALCHFMFELLKNQSADTEANMIPPRELSSSKILERPMFHLITALCWEINCEHGCRTEIITTIGELQNEGKGRGDIHITLARLGGKALLTL